MRAQCLVRVARPALWPCLRPRLRGYSGERALPEGESQDRPHDKLARVSVSREELSEGSSDEATDESDVDTSSSDDTTSSDSDSDGEHDASSRPEFRDEPFGLDDAEGVRVEPDPARHFVPAGVPEGINYEAIVEKWKANFQGRPLERRGQQFTAMMEVCADLDTALTNELPMDSVENIVKRFSDEQMSKVIEKLDGMINPHTSTKALMAGGYPELADEGEVEAHPRDRFYSVLQLLLDEFREQYATTQVTRRHYQDIKVNESNAVELKPGNGGQGMRVAVGQLLIWTPETLAKALPEGVQGARLVNKLMTDVCKGGLQFFVRPVYKELADAINSHVGKAGAFVLDGKRYVGKSLTLIAMGLLARESGWLVVYLDALKFVDGGNVQRAKYDDDMWDQPINDREHCELLLKAEGEKFAKISIKSKGVPVTGGGTFKTLKDLLQFGAAAEDEMATAALVWFRQELTLVTEFRVLVLVDNYSVLYNPSNYGDMDSKKFVEPRLMPNRLTVPRLFMRPQLQHFRNGVMVVATTRESSRPAHRFDAMCVDAGLTKLHLPKFSVSEHNDLYDSYVDANWLHNESQGLTTKYTYGFCAATPGEFLRFSYLMT